MIARQKVLDAVKSDIAARREHARIAHDRTLAAIRQRRADETDRVRAEAGGLLSEAESRAAARRQNLAERQTKAAQDLQTRFDEEIRSLKRSLEEALMMAEAMREAGEDGERKKTRELNERLTRALAEADELEAKAKQYIRSCRLAIPTVAVDASAASPAGSATDDADAELQPEREIQELLGRGREHLDEILSTRAARLIAGIAPFALAPAVVLGAGALGGAVALFEETRWPISAAIWSGSALVLAVLTLAILRGIATGAMRRVWAPFQADLAAIRVARDRALRNRTAATEIAMLRLKDTEREEERDAHERYDGPIADLPVALARREKRLRDAVAVETEEIEREERDVAHQATTRR